MTGRFAVLAALTVGATATAQQPVFRASIEVVAVDVAVTRGRNAVPNLTVADFAVLDDGVQQTVASVTRDTLPLDLTLVVDQSGSQADEFTQFLRAAAEMQRSLREGDRWRWLGLYTEARELLPMQSALSEFPSVGRPRPSGMSALHDTVFLALVRPGVPERRHLVVVFSDGNDNWSLVDGRRLPAIATRADAVLHVVISATPPSSGTGALERHAVRWRESQKVLFDAVDESGGSIHHLANKAEAFARIIEDFRSAYVLRYVPQGVDTPGWHDIKVSVNRPGSFNIRARKGYERRP